MSSCGNPNVEKDALMQRREKYDGKTKICVKCKENTGDVVVRYAVYCKSCFFPLVQTRFKKALEPSINPIPDGSRRKALKAAGSLVAGFSGGTCSTAMLDLVAKTYFAPQASGDDVVLKGGKEHPRNAERSVWKGRPAVCYVEVCGVFMEEKDRTDDIRAVVDRFPGNPFDFVPLRLENCFDPAWWDRVGGGDLSSSAQSLGLNMTDEDLHLSPGPSSLSQNSSLFNLRSYLASLPTQTAFQNAIQTLTRLLLLHTAASRRASHLLLGTSLTSLSVNLISSIAQGSGFAVAEEAKEEWTPRPHRGISVRVVRPLRDIGMKECAIWNWWSGSRPVPRSIHNSGGGRNAIDSLTRDFIFGLEADYPATVSTIARTCGKLAPKEPSDVICILCERPAQRDVQAWKARISIRAYSEASSAVSAHIPSHLAGDEMSKLTTAQSPESISSNSLTPHLCYTCHTTLTSRSSRGTAAPLPPGQIASSVPLPTWVQSTLTSSTLLRPVNGAIPAGEVLYTKKLTREDMKSAIGDFLIES